MLNYSAKKKVFQTCIPLIVTRQPKRPWAGAVQIQRPNGVLQRRPFQAVRTEGTKASGEDLRWFVIDTILISEIDINGVVMLKDLKQRLASQNVQLVLAGRQSEFVTRMRHMGEPVENVSELTYPTLRQAVNAFHGQ